MKKLDIYHRIPDSLCEITKQIAIGTFLIKKKKNANRIILYRILIRAFVSQIRTIKISECSARICTFSQTCLENENSNWKMTKDTSIVPFCTKNVLTVKMIKRSINFLIILSTEIVQLSRLAHRKQQILPFLYIYDIEK